MKNFKYLIVVVLIAVVTSASAQKINFTGNYQIDLSRTDFGKAPHFVLPKKISINQGKDKLIISRGQLNKELLEEPPVVDTLGYDSKQFTKISPSGVKTVSTLRWPDNFSFTIHRQSKSATVETWTLEDSGKTLVLRRDVVQGDGFKYTIIGYYSKL